MTPKIHILPEPLCNKIAAGEVVERPSSVVKELIENSIDAGASRLEIDLEAGGKKLIRVRDDGCGMNRQDAFLSFERHATSKIRTDDDLFALTTLGFRGEALASIASVSRLRLSTCDNQDGDGQRIYSEGGHIKKVEDVGLPQGTDIEVRNLFYNLPARKKFLRKEQTELGHAADVVTKQALAKPRVSFVLRHNGRVLLDLRHEKGLPERVASLLGRSLLKDMQTLEADGPVALTGLISQPQLNRSAASHIYTFINGRYIRDRVVQHAVMEGYRNLLMKGRYPVAVLFLEMDPALVDVNVHPTKHEVRFRDQSLIHDFIAESIRSALRPAQWVASPGNDDMNNSVSVVPSLASPTEPSGVFDKKVTSVPQTIVTDGRPLSQKTDFNIPLQGAAEVPLYVKEESSAEQYVLPGSRPEGFFSGLHILGHYHQSYILCQDEDDLVLIDQHAAHERVGFEALKMSFRDGDIPTQALLFPEILELDHNSAVALSDNIEQLSRLGFEVEPFGGNAFALKAVPQLLTNTSVANLVVDVALDLERIGRSGQLRDSIDDVLIRIACHSVVRANQALSVSEVQALFKDMDKIDFKANCPHGRPVMHRMTLYDVERLFRRQ